MSKHFPVADLARVAAAGVDGPTAIVEPGRAGVANAGGETVAEGRPCLLEVDRERDDGSGGIDGTIAVYGANLHNPFAAPLESVQTFEADDAGTQVNFDCEQIPYAAQANHNNIVVQDGEILTPGAGAGKFVVTNNGGLLRVTLGTAAPKKSRVVVHRVTPQVVLADGAHGIERARVNGKKLLWLLLTYNGGALSRTLVALRSLV